MTLAFCPGEAIQSRLGMSLGSSRNSAPSSAPFWPGHWRDSGAHHPLPLVSPPIPPAPLPRLLGPGLAFPPQCSATCGEGIQQRQVVCRTNANSLGQCEGDKPDTVQVCRLPACAGELDRVGGRPGSSGRGLKPSPACILALPRDPKP